MQELKGKVALVTGASEGIGRATALRLAAEGVHVTICARRSEPLAKAEQEIRAAGGSVEAQQLDVADADAFAALIADVSKRHGRFDMLVNNAHSVHYGPVVDTSLESWRKDFAVNADAVFIGTREAMRVMIPRRSGSIVNISSVNGIRAMPAMAAYSASKAALIQFTAVAAMEGAPHNVRVNALVPGLVATPGASGFEENRAADEPDAAMATIPMRRAGRPEELAATIAFLLSEEASYITGVALSVDGGKAAQLYVPA